MLTLADGSVAGFEMRNLTPADLAVEAQTQFAPLAELGFDLVQGYGIAKPLSEADAAVWLGTRDRRDDDSAAAARSA